MRKPSARRLAFVITSGIALFGVASMFQPTVVVGESMAPTLEDGRLIYVDRVYYRTHLPRRGEVVVFRHDGEVYVKRVYRGPGEVLSYVESGGAFCSLLADRDIAEAERRYADGKTILSVQQTRVPQDSIWVLGDNFMRSEDSRQFGAVPIEDIIGRARVRVQPTFGQRFEFHGWPNLERAGSHIRRAGSRRSSS